MDSKWKKIKIKYIANLQTGNSINASDKDEKYSEQLDTYYPYIATKDIDVNNDNIHYDNGLYIPRNTSFKIAKKNTILLCIEGGSAGRKIGYLDRDVCFVNKLCNIEPISEVNNRFLYYTLKSYSFINQFNINTTGIIPGVSVEKLKNFFIYIPERYQQEKIVNFLDKKVSQIDSIIEKTKQSIEELKKYRRTLITETVTRGINPNIEMKDSGIEGLEMVPKHWNIVKLRYLIQFQPPKSEIKEKNIECTFLPMEKLKNGKMVLDENRIIDEVYTGYTYFKENDIVLAKVTPCFENGNIAIAKNLTNSIGFGTTEIYTLRAKKISKEFLFYALQDERFKNEGISSMYGTGGLKRVPGNFILNYKVLVPSNTEQQQIVDFLNEKTEYIENLIIKKKELLNEMESYKKSLIYEYVTGKKEVM
jgi:type I restriction enzyme, S subunit